MASRGGTDPASHRQTLPCIMTRVTIYHKGCRVGAITQLKDRPQRPCDICMAGLDVYFTGQCSTGQRTGRASLLGLQGAQPLLPGTTRSSFRNLSSSCWAIVPPQSPPASQPLIPVTPLNCYGNCLHTFPVAQLNLKMGFDIAWTCYKHAKNSRAYLSRPSNYRDCLLEKPGTPSRLATT